LVSKISFIWSPVKICRDTALDRVLFSINMRSWFLPISNITTDYILLDHCYFLHAEWQRGPEHHLTPSCWLSNAMDSTLVCGLHYVLAWLLVVCTVCGSLVDYYVLWVATSFMIIQRPLRFKKVDFVWGTHLGSWRLHMKIIGGQTSNLYGLIIEQMDILESWFRLIYKTQILGNFDINIRSCFS
jgi:hypothetical protein